MELRSAFFTTFDSETDIIVTLDVTVVLMLSPLFIY